MKVFRPDQDVTVKIPFVDSDGVAISGVTQVDYTVYDELGQEVVALTNIPGFVASDGEVEVEVLAADNSIGEQIHGLRKVELTITAPTGVFYNSVSYILESPSSLEFLFNSFQTYEEAVLTRRTLTELPGWDRATEAARKSALMQAYDTITAYTYEFFSDGTSSWTGNFEDFTLEDWDELATSQQQDFLKAQLIQADYYLGGSPIEQGINDGLQSSTIGEISQFFRPRASLSLRMCRGATRYVGRYIVWSKSIGRA